MPLNRKFSPGMQELFYRSACREESPVGKGDFEYGLEPVNIQCAFRPVNGLSHR
jgi:hypothetical protein